MAVREEETLYTFQYEAITPAGSRIKGSKARMQAYNMEMVRRELMDQGFIPISIFQVQDKGLNRDLTGKTSVKMKTPELAGFTRQLHELLRAGVSAPRAISSLAEEAPSPKLQEMCLDLANRLSAGSSLAEAFAAYPRAFNEVYRAYLASGERTGAIVEATTRLAKVLERQAKMRSKVISVITYPALIGGVISVIVVGILVFLVPRFEAIYASFEAPLPRPTQILVSLSRKMPFILGIGSVAIFVATRQIRKTADKIPSFGIRLDKIRFKLPIAGKLFHRAALYRWSTTLAGSLEAGLPQSQALEIAGDASGSRWIKAVTAGFVEGITTGRPLSSMIGEPGWLFPAQVRTMISTGETSGELPRLLESSSESLDSEIDAMVASMGAKVEVLLLLFLGGSVGGMLIVLYLPIITLASTVGNNLS
jgi:type IV pilus assembly protein PilC